MVTNRGEGSSFNRFTDDCMAWYIRDRDGRYLKGDRTPVADIIELLSDPSERDRALQALADDNLNTVGTILRRAHLIADP